MRRLQISSCSFSPLVPLPSSLFIPVFIVARLAGLAGLSELRLAGVEITSLRDLGQLGNFGLHLLQLGLEVVHVEPDFRLGLGFAGVRSGDEAFQRKLAHESYDLRVARERGGVVR